MGAGEVEVSVIPPRESGVGGAGGSELVPNANNEDKLGQEDSSCLFPRDAD